MDGDTDKKGFERGGGGNLTLVASRDKQEIGKQLQKGSAEPSGETDILRVWRWNNTDEMRKSDCITCSKLKGGL